MRYILILAAISLSGCATNDYYYPQYNNIGTSFSEGYYKAKERQYQRQQRNMARDIRDIKDSLNIW